MRSPTTAGEEWPGGTATFQTTLVSGPISAGSLAASARPVQLGPRNCGQSAARAGRVRREASRAAVTRWGFVSMGCLAGRGGCGHGWRFYPGRGARTSVRENGPPARAARAGRAYNTPMSTPRTIQWVGGAADGHVRL